MFYMLTVDKVFNLQSVLDQAN